MFKFLLYILLYILINLLFKEFDSRIKNSKIALRQIAHQMLIISVIINIRQNKDILALRLMVIYVSQDIIARLRPHVRMYARFREK